MSSSKRSRVPTNMPMPTIPEVVMDDDDEELPPLDDSNFPVPSHCPSLYEELPPSPPRCTAVSTTTTTTSSSTPPSGDSLTTPPPTPDREAGLLPPPRASKKQFCNAMFTSFCEINVQNPSWLAEQFKSDPNVTFFVFQREIAPTTMQRHLQGYIEFKKRTYLNRVQQILHDRVCHVEPRYGSQDQAINYCSKEDTRDPSDGSGPFRGGLPKVQGKRSDLESLATDLMGGSTLRDVANSYPSTFIRSATGIQKFCQVISPMRPADFKPRVLLFIGIPGAGKTRDARALALGEGHSLYCKTAGHKWFSFYTGQTAVILDEYSGGTLPYATLLQYLDRGEWSVEDKGIAIPWNARLIIVTSNFPPSRWYKEGFHVGALCRRFDECRIYFEPDQFFTITADPLDLSWRDGSRMAREIDDNWTKLILPRHPEVHFHAPFDPFAPCLATTPGSEPTFFGSSETEGLNGV